MQLPSAYSWGRWYVTMPRAAAYGAVEEVLIERASRCDVREDRAIGEPLDGRVVVSEGIVRGRCDVRLLITSGASTCTLGGNDCRRVASAEVAIGVVNPTTSSLKCKAGHTHTCGNSVATVPAIASTS